MILSVGTNYGLRSEDWSIAENLQMMSTIRIHDKTFEIYLSESAIQERVKNIADSINEEYRDKKAIVHCYFKWLIYVCF